MKKGQITIFIILGLLVLIMIGLGLYLLYSGTGPTEIDPDSFDSETSVLITDVEQCAERLTIDYLQEISLSGGYDVTDDVQYTYPEAHKNKGVTVFDEDNKVPYWYHLDAEPECNGDECDFEYNVPLLEGGQSSIQGQVESFVKDNISECVGSFSQYEDSFDVAEEGIDTVEVNFNEDDTEVTVQWPMTLKKSESEIELEEFSERIDLPYRQLYETAEDVVFEIIMMERGLENYALKVQNLLSFAEDSELPPMNGGAKFGLTAPEIWLQSDAKEEFEQGLYENINFLQVYGSPNSRMLYTENPYLQNMHEEFMFELENNTYLSDIAVEFDYFPQWDTYMNIEPSSGEVVMPEEVGGLISFLPLKMTRYNFDYYISYPTMITLEHEDALDGEGFDLRFAAEGNIQANTYVGETESFESNPSVTDDGGSSDFTRSVSPLAASEQQSTVPVQVELTDGYTGQPKGDVEVTYQCGDRAISLGESSADGVVDSTVAPCIDGTLKITDPTIFAEEQTASIVLDGENSFEMDVYEEQEMDVEITKVDSNKNNTWIEEDIPRWNRSLTDTELSSYDDESGTILFNRVGSDQYFRAAELDNLSRRETINLAPGEYEITSIVNMDLGNDSEFDNIQLAGEEICSEASFIGISISEECEMIEGEQINDSLLTGFLGYNEDNNLSYEITPEKIDENDILDIKVKSYDFTDSAVEKGVDEEYNISSDNTRILQNADFTATRDMDVLGFITNVDKNNTKEIDLLEPEFR